MSLRDEELSRETLIFVPFETDNDIDRPSRRGTLCIATQVLCALCALATVSLSLREKGQKPLASSKDLALNWRSWVLSW
jgi:hypothetical protein